MTKNYLLYIHSVLKLELVKSQFSVKMNDALAYPENVFIEVFNKHFLSLKAP